MKKSEVHLQQLARFLEEIPRLSLADATRWLGVSESTARRLFMQMEQRGQGIRIHGGIASLPDKLQEYSYDLVENHVLGQKKRIAAEAVKEIMRPGHVYLDSGSTVYQVSRALVEAIQAGPKPEVTVFTNSLKNIEVLAGHVNIQLIGGRYRTNRRDFGGFLAESALEQLHFDLCILGADGIAPDTGFTTTDFETARMNALALSHAERSVVVADTSKFNVRALVSYARLDAVARIITDRLPPEDTLSSIQAAGVQVDCV